ncbi:MFS transporter [Antribacter sp. KLBMP9083]|uniref:MFS transporter n=1 Tax=Antribacter soli TaxID=2910976 RepID=A0AA41UB40_9MICO|nr:MFS transporter [Antribacter soli]MCF4120734.1 MFS transporter [Antribacter soli]
MPAQTPTGPDDATEPTTEPTSPLPATPTPEPALNAALGVVAAASTQAVRRGTPGQVVAWSLWDWGSAAFNAVVTTFVFTTWLTSGAFVEEGENATDIVARNSSWIGVGLAVAGILVALLAPALGALADSQGRRKPWLAVNTIAVVGAMVAMFWIEPTPGSKADAVILGVVLLAVGNVFFELASVAYNALLLQISTPRTIGRVSGLGWGAGYVGGIVLLVILFVGFISPEVGWFGVTGEMGMDIRVSVLLSAVWYFLFALPVLLFVPDAPRRPAGDRVNLIGAYGKLGRDIAVLWRGRRSTLWYLLASAVYRDGLAGVFTFGGILAVGTFGFEADQVIVFAIVANVVAGLATIAAGWLDDLIGPRLVVIGSLVGLVVAGLALFLQHDGGAQTFWVWGLALTLFVGPAQSASRALLARITDPGHETEAFGLYATTGRAASFLAQAAFAVFISVMGAQYWGILGIMLVIVLGLVLMLLVRFPRGSGVDGRRDLAVAAV